MSTEQLRKDAIRFKEWHERQAEGAKDCAMFNVTPALQEIAEGHEKAAATIAALLDALSQPAQAGEVTDEQINNEIAAKANLVRGSFCLVGYDALRKFARAILALRPQAVQQAEIEALRAELDDMTVARDEALRAPWPEWAKKIRDRIRESSGYDGFDDQDGVDLPEEVNEHLSEIERQNERLREQLASLRPQAVPMTPEQGPPTEPGLYAWVGVGNTSLVLVNRRPSDNTPGGQLNGHVINSTRFYDGCAVADWGSDGRWVLLKAHGITAKAEVGEKP